MSKLTIIDIAKMAGVSPSSVSLAINNRPGVSESTRRRIMDIVKQTNFVPSQSARSQIMKVTQNIAVLFNINSHPLDHLFHEGLNKYILKYCTENRYNLVFVACQFHDDLTPVELPPIILSRGVDGVVSYGYVPVSVITSLHKLDIPYLLLDSHQLPTDTMSIIVDYYAATQLAIQHLIKNGHKRIAYIGSNFPPQYSQQTFEGYRSMLEKLNIQVPLQWIQMQSSDVDGEDSAVIQVQSIMKSGERPTAVFCAADIYAIGAIRGIKQLGLRIPEDVSVIGIDDILVSSYIDPPLTTIRVDDEKLAKMGFDMLFKSITGSTHDKIHEIFSEFAVIERQSVRQIK
ncbi:MAG TPA: hypothetical protein DIW17_04375 [Clostridiales bacterium]|nr:hypothetical protein [Clostridiales bacterium]